MAEVGQGVVEGRIVHYILSEDDAQQINRRRTTGTPILHVGNMAQTGDHCAAIIVRFWGDQVSGTSNLQVFLDGNDVYWATSRAIGEGPGTWHWPERA